VPAVTQQQADLNRTVPSEAFAAAPAAGGSMAPSAAASPPGADPVLRGATLAPQLRSHGYRFEDASDADGRRFAVSAMLGTGATASVYAAFDRNLSRDVAVKVLTRTGATASEDVASFVDEARTTASLEHPNVLPVHELDVNERGEVYFTMKRIAGRSLGELINASTPAARAARIATYSALVPLFIAVGHALSYAHHRGVIHQDVKPDNIMIGDFGEVLLVDWGSAVRADAPTQRLYGTPLYMAPEQARLERVDARTDVFAFGATLFHTLTLRLPTWDDDADRFWDKKRRGEIEAPTPGERRIVPAQLLAIALKAIAARAEDRYASVDAMIRDLEGYQGGQAVSAYRDSPLERCARWHRRHARAIWSTAAASAIIAVLGGLLYGERLTRIATWGSPVAVADFEDDRWQRHWMASGHMLREDGQLVDQTNDGGRLSYRQRLAGDAAVEFDGEIPEGTLCGDLSVLWSRDALYPVDQRLPIPKETYALQFGAHGGGYSRIIGPDGRILAMSLFSQRSGTRYHVRAEILDRTLRLIVDGNVICSYTDPLQSLGGGWLQLYTYYRGKRVDDVRVYARGVAHLIPAIAIADHDAHQGEYEEAISEYRRVVEVEGATAAGMEARYKWGNCEYRSGRFDDAFAAWSVIDRAPWLGLVAVHRIDRWFSDGAHDRALAEFAKLYATADPDLRQQLAIGWNGHALRLTSEVHERGEPGTLIRYLAARDESMPGDVITATQAASALLELGRFEEVLERFPFLVFSCQEACALLGHPERTLTLTQEPTVRCGALLAMGCPQEVLDRYPDSGLAMMAFARVGRAEDLLAHDPRSADALYQLGRIDELRAIGGSLVDRMRAFLGEPIPADSPYRDESWAMMAEGRYDEAMTRYRNHATMGMWPRHWFMLDAYIRGNTARAMALAEVPPGWEFRQLHHFDFVHYVVVPFLRELSGDRQAFERMASDTAERRYARGQAPWHYVHLVTGRIDEAAFRQWQVRVYQECALALCSGVARERAGDPAGAMTWYGRYLDLPKWKRGREIDPVVERFVQWRVATLRGSQEK
jgi:eukaryotic-like serine/threonine-protein kinase